MKSLVILVFSGVLFMILLFAGCTGTVPAGQEKTPVPTTSVILSPSQTATRTAIQTTIPFPDALTLGEYATFGSGKEQGKATVYRYEVRPNYTWTSPSWNSPREQAAATQPFDIQEGYTIEKPQEGNTYLIVFIRVVNTGEHAVYAPSAKQFVVFRNGTAYNYSSVHSSDVIIDKITGTQYDYQIGRGGTVGYVLPGESNSADGYLIYEIPAPFSPGITYVVSNLDYQNRAVWKLE